MSEGTPPDAASLLGPPLPLAPSDLDVVADLLVATVGAGFADLPNADRRLSFVIRESGGRLAGVVLSTLADPSDCMSDAEVRRAARHSLGNTLPDVILHVRDLAVAPAWRRHGIATALLRLCERSAIELGAGAALVYAWLPASAAESAGPLLYEGLGYRTAVDIPRFFSEWSVREDIVCPVCGAPPCLCGVRVMVKPLP